MINFQYKFLLQSNITGGQAIQSSYALTLLAKDWVQSSYYTEGTTTILTNAYLYSFGADPSSTARHGTSFNHHQFAGNEQLQIQFTTASTSAFVVSIYAHVQSAIEVGPTYVKKVSL